MQITFVDLFAGIGGFRCALQFKGARCILSNEIDKYSLKTYSSWYGNEQLNSSDIRSINISKDIPNHDILCAGFPCQPFSLAGVSKKNSLGKSHGLNDQKSGDLFFKILEIVSKKRPKVIFLENVKNLKSHDKGRTWELLKKLLDQSGYNVFSKIIDAQYCVPQHRERFFIVCFRKDKFSNKKQFNFFNIINKKQPKLYSILNTNPSKNFMITKNLWSYLQDYAHKHKLKGNGFSYGLHEKNQIARTLSARYYKDGAEILINEKKWTCPRKLSPNEAKKLMGFNNKYARFFGHKKGFPIVVSNSQAYKQFGNAVVPQVIEDIYESILNYIS